nr:Aminopeptidase S (Leu, Val, Phe, Tyr preference) (EC 3.4.11.24) [Kibdelosporangium sp. MJ126-NF4]
MSDRLDRYASVLLEVGVRLQPGQRLAVNADLQHAPLARALAERAYRMGAHYVDIWYWDPYAKRSRIRHAPEDTLSATPDWLNRRYESLADAGDALVVITGDPEPDLLAGLDERRAGLDRMPAIASRYHAQRFALIAWTIAAYPTAQWAQTVFGTPDVERLWSYIEQFLYLDQPDPVAALQARMNQLRSRARQLTELNLDAVRFVGPGTDLTLGLIPGAHWSTSEQDGPHGHPVMVNMPTEEVFTTPDHRRVEGYVTSTKPLALNKTIVRDLRLTVTGGRITEVAAATGADVVRSQLTRDDGASRFGEVALVDDLSPIGRSGITFLDTLLDENATCHLAWGSGIPTVLTDWRDLTTERLEQRGINQSGTHVDFMVGGPEVTVTGIRRDGSTVELLRQEHWQLEQSR